MGSKISISTTSYCEEKSMKNWAGEFAKREVTEHKIAPVLDHPDGSVTESKLSADVKKKFAELAECAKTANETANTARAIADSVKVVANAAKITAENALSAANSAESEALSAKSASEHAVYLATDTKSKLYTKADKTELNYVGSSVTGFSYEFSSFYNTDIRTSELANLSFTFGNGEYAQDYISGISFGSGETPTSIDYTDSGILNWVGTDCATSDGLSIFQPSANTHYDIVFYFNGTQFIGLVNGYVPATGNEAV